VILRAPASLLPLAMTMLFAGASLGDEELPEGELPSGPEDTAPAPRERESNAEELLPPRLVVQTAIEEHEAAVQKCAQPAEGKRWSSGRVTVAWRIERDGSVADVQVRENTTGNTELGQCLARLVEELEFEPTPSGKPARVSYPFEIVAPASQNLLGWLSGLLGCG